jgi:hypothetical protein|tara:strand:+ start:9345 stop:9515 length:171 start_codon:yes stop_codon:yes gene_type:complete
MYSSPKGTDEAADMNAIHVSQEQAITDENEKGEVIDDEGEVFRSDTGHAEFRALGW